MCNICNNLEVDFWVLKVLSSDDDSNLIVYEQCFAQVSLFFSWAD
jgi:hypothetical protein